MTYKIGDKILEDGYESTIRGVGPDGVSIISNDPRYPPTYGMLIGPFLSWLKRPGVKLQPCEAVKIDVHENHDIIDNTVLGKSFKYCRDCKEEIV